MALDKATLKASIESAFDFEATQIDSPDASRSRIAQALADAIEIYVKGGDGIYQGGMTAGANNVIAVGVPIKIE